MKQAKGAPSPQHSAGSKTCYARPSSKVIVGTATVIVAVVAYQLLQTARQTGNFEGLWFSLLHTVLVAVATVLALGSKQRS
jgi:hypothetical protein